MLKGVIAKTRGFWRGGQKIEEEEEKKQEEKKEKRQV